MNTRKREGAEFSFILWAHVFATVHLENFLWENLLDIFSDRPQQVLSLPDCHEVWFGFMVFMCVVLRKKRKVDVDVTKNKSVFVKPIANWL